MEDFIVDLYKYFNIDKPSRAKGVLTCHLQQGSDEVSAMLVVAGGGYIKVSKRESQPVADKYFAAGMSTFMLEYSTAETSHYPMQLIEFAMAMIYIRKNAKQLKVIPSKVASVGFSAGGHLLLCGAFLYKNRIMRKTFSKDYLLIRPDALILSYPVVTSGKYAHKGSFSALCNDDQALISKMSMEKYVTKKSPIAFLWATSNDGSVPIKNTLLLADRYAKVGAPFALHIFQSGEHGLSTGEESANEDWRIVGMSKDVPKWVELSINFLRENGF